MRAAYRSWLSLLVNIVLPAVVLTRFSGEGTLGPVWGLVVALAFPILYGLYELVQERRVAAIPVIGFVGVLLTGGIGLLRLPVEWVAVKEAAVPLVIALLVLATYGTRYSVVERLLDQMLEMKKVRAALVANGVVASYQKRLRGATYGIAGSFLISTVLNFTLARVLVTAEAGTRDFNLQLGKLTALSYPVIAIPSMTVLIAAVIYLVRGIEQETGLELQDIIKQP